MNFLKYLVAYLPARILFFVGDAISKTEMDSDLACSVYQFMMRWSYKIDEAGATSLWKEP